MFISFMIYLMPGFFQMSKDFAVSLVHVKADLIVLLWGSQTKTAARTTWLREGKHPNPPQKKTQKNLCLA